MLRLFVLRHAKSSWTVPGRRDFERTLNERGIRDLPHIALAMKDRGYIPDYVYCSAAARTKQTLEGIFENIEQQVESTFLQSLYSEGMDAYLETIKGHSGSGSIMIIGHNPTCHSLANHLVGKGDTEQLNTLAVKYPTGAMSVIDFPVATWAEVSENSGQLIDFMLPRLLR